MVIISVILLVIFVVASILLMIVVLVQDEQGDGMGGIFGGGSSTPFGSRSGNILTKITSVLGAVFILTSFGLAWINRSAENGDVIGAALRQENAVEKKLDWWKTEQKNENIAPGSSGSNSDQVQETIPQKPAK